MYINIIQKFQKSDKKIFNLISLKFTFPFHSAKIPNMNSKVGIDIVYIPKFKEKINKNGQVFLTKVFSESELEEAGGNVESLAGKFALKEAFVKTLTDEMYFLNQIEILKQNNRPYIRFKNQCFYNVSISHEKNYAIAIFIRD